MPILEEDELAEIRQDIADVFEEVYPDTGSLKRFEATTRDAVHKEVQTNPLMVIAENVPCKYRSSTPRELMVAGKPQTSTSYTIEMPATIQVRESDVFVIDAKGDDPAMEFDVTGNLMKSNALKWRILATKR